MDNRSALQLREHGYTVHVCFVDAINNVLFINVLQFYKKQRT